MSFPRDAKRKANQRLVVYSDSEDDDEYRPSKRLTVTVSPPPPLLRGREEKDSYISQIEKMPILDPHVKAQLISDATTYEKISESSEEKHKQRRYLEGITKVPFGKFAGVDIKRSDGFDKKREFLGKIKYNMDKHIYGQDEAKNTIIEIIAKRINNPDGKGNVIALAGPPGVGKTSLIRDGLAKAYGVPFNFIGLGGARHTALLKGSDFSFVGSTWGKIVGVLMKSGCMDPIIFFDELDKISTSDEGQDVISCLVHLTDPSQNTEWEDTYFAGIPFDLSKATFIFSLNDQKMIPEPLLDRITIVNMNGFSEKEKINITRNYCIPRLCLDIGFNQKEIIISDDTLHILVKKYCKEPGVRKLEQCIRTILMKFNFFHMVELGDKSYEPFGPYEIDPHTAGIILDPIFGSKKIELEKVSMEKVNLDLPGE